MKISIVTVTKNNKAGLLRAIESVRSQTYKNVEHIVVDGESTDGSVEVLKNLQFTIHNLQFISEADSGIYDAINKGIKLATGVVIGLLHSDDFYADEFVLENYAEAFSQRAKRQAHSDSNYQPPTNNPLLTSDFLLPSIDAVYSDLVYVRSKTKDEKREKNNFGIIEHLAFSTEHSVIRNWKTHRKVNSELLIVNSETTAYYSPLTTYHLLTGWMPPHPTLFVRREVFEKYGLYRTDMKIAADYEMILRLFYKSKITASYLPFTTYCMTIGGASNKSLKNILIKSSEDYRAMKLHKIPFPFYTLLCKNFSKIKQFF